MGAYNSDSKRTQFFKLKIVKDSGVPYFFRREKKGDVYVDTEQMDTVQGYLTQVVAETYKFEGEDQVSIKFHMNDDSSDDKIVVSSGLNNMVRGFLNSLDGCDAIGLVNMKAAKWGKTDKKYATIFATNNGQKTSWKYPIDELPRVEEIKNKAGKVIAYDSAESDKFFIEKVIPSINKKIVNEFQAESEMKKPTGSTDEKAYAGDSPQPIKDDLPFAKATFQHIPTMMFRKKKSTMNNFDYICQ